MKHMKKQKKFTKQISDGFVARKALAYWRNLIANYDEDVSDRDFFEFFGRCDAQGEAVKKIKVLYAKEQLEEIGCFTQGRRSAYFCGREDGLGDDSRTFGVDTKGDERA